MATSVSPETSGDWVTARRPSRVTTLDPLRPHAFFLEEELSRAGKVATSGTILLTNKECPWRCVMCDLWKNTLTETVPPGAIPEQIRFALAQFGTTPEQLKLYNSGSFFDSAAIPVADYADISTTVAIARHIIVESHPRLVGERALRFRDLLSGSLEVAMGLETIHPKAMPRLNKKFDLNHFREAAEFLRNNGTAMRAFVLVNPPFIGEEEGLEWAVKSAAFAFSCGAGVVSLIPTRGGNGALEALRASGEFAPPTISSVERALELTLALRGGRVFADTWDLEKFYRCRACFEPRRKRLQAMNLTQKLLPLVECPRCGPA